MNASMFKLEKRQNKTVRLISMDILRNSKHVTLLIKTITKFSNVIGYQQPDLSIHWTVALVMLVIGQYASFFARCCGALC